MTPGLADALVALAGFGSADLIYKRAALAGVPANQLLMLQSWFFTPLVTIYAASTGTIGFVAGTWWGALAGLFVMIGFYNFAVSLRLGSISVNAPIFRLSFIITAALAILLLGEPLNNAKILAMALALAAVWLLLGEPAKTERAAPARLSSSLFRVSIATLSVGISNLIYKFGLHAGAPPMSMLIAQGMVVVLISTTLTARIEGRVRPMRRALRFAPWSALSLVVAFGFLVHALIHGQASVVVPIAQMGFGVTAVMGFVFFGEKFTARKGIGLLAALGALASFAWGA